MVMGWRIVLVGFLVALPVLAMVAAGGYALVRSGYALWMWWLFPLCWGLAALTQWLTQPKHAKFISPKPEDPLQWTNRDSAAGRLVEQYLELTLVPKAGDPPVDLTSPKTYERTAAELTQQITQHYHPRESDPVANLTVLEILTATQPDRRRPLQLVEKSYSWQPFDDGEALAAVGKPGTVLGLRKTTCGSWAACCMTRLRSLAFLFRGLPWSRSLNRQNSNFW